MSNKDRELQYWITKHINRELCWVTIARIGEMISHEKREIYNGNTLALDTDSVMDLSQDTLEYVYISDIDSAKIFVFVTSTSGKYYIIRNTRTITKIKKEQDGKEVEENVAELTSKIYVANSFSNAIKLFTSKELKKYGLKSPKFTQKDNIALNGIVCVDFIHKTIEEQKALWKKYLLTVNEVLDLSGFQMLTHEIVASSKVNKSVHTLILYQNTKMLEFEWIKTIIPNVKTVAVWLSNTFDNNVVANLVDNVPLLNEFEIHQCYNLDSRVLIDILKLKLLDKLIIDNITLKCQESIHNTLITDEEWKTIFCDSLTFILINSDNFTVDFTDYLLKACPNIKRMIVSDGLIKKLHESTLDGISTETLIFQSFKNKEYGFKRCKTVKFFNLIKSKANKQPFSDSMLKIIEAKKKEKEKKEQEKENENTILT